MPARGNLVCHSCRATAARRLANGYAIDSPSDRVPIALNTVENSWHSQQFDIDSRHGLSTNSTCTIAAADQMPNIDRFWTVGSELDSSYALVHPH